MGIKPEKKEELKKGLKESWWNWFKYFTWINIFAVITLLIKEQSYSWTEIIPKFFGFFYLGFLLPLGLSFIVTRYLGVLGKNKHQKLGFVISPLIIIIFTLGAKWAGAGCYGRECGMITATIILALGLWLGYRENLRAIGIIYTLEEEKEIGKKKIKKRIYLNLILILLVITINVYKMNLDQEYEKIFKEQEEINCLKLMIYPQKQSFCYYAQAKWGKNPEMCEKTKILGFIKTRFTQQCQEELG